MKTGGIIGREEKIKAFNEDYVNLEFWVNS